MRLNQTPGIARWTTRVALFSVVLATVALAAHRFGPMPTVTAFNLVLIAFIGAVTALVLGLVSGIIIWRTGCAGTFRVTAGIVMGVVLLVIWGSRSGRFARGAGLTSLVVLIAAIAMADVRVRLYWFSRYYWFGPHWWL